MKKVLLIMSLFSSFFGVKAQADNVIELLSPAEFISCTNHDDVQFIDVRTQKEFAAGVINNPINLDYYQQKTFLEGLKDLDKNRPVYVYCQAGGRSAKAAKILKKNGFQKVYDLHGGYSSISKR
ncbi:rhodanese-like domain-containing protein [Christiangramia echinicola]|nr:rhodanese-like domain-containing protein [Christiangramia echinicola]